MRDVNMLLHVFSLAGYDNVVLRSVWMVTDEKKESEWAEKESAKFEMRMVRHRGQNLDFKMKNSCVNNLIWNAS